MYETTLVVQLSGCTVRASVLRVPGRDGRGAFVAEVVVGESVETTGFRATVPEARRDLVAVLARRGWHDTDGYAERLRPRLVYGGAWAAGELEKQPGYAPRVDPAVAELRRRFLNLLWAACPADWEVQNAGDRAGSRRGASVFEIRFVSGAGRSVKGVYLDRNIRRAAERGVLNELALDAKAAVGNL